MTGDAELVEHKALEVMLLIRAGIFDQQLELILTAVTDRMASPDRRRQQPRPPPPADWPIGQWFNDDGG